jgi:hypothetical protein
MRRRIPIVAAPCKSAAFGFEQNLCGAVMSRRYNRAPDWPDTC